MPIQEKKSIDEAMEELLDEWTYPTTAEQLLNVELNEITKLRVYKGRKNQYTLLRCFWMVDHPEVSCDCQEVDADTLIKKLGSLLGSLL